MFARYRSVREKGTGSKDEDSVRTAVPEEGETNEQNPSIARSMSRYRRKRPSVNGNSASASMVPPTPMLPNHARTRTEVAHSLPIDATETRAAREERARERHRQHTMEQLIGGNQPSHSIPLRPAKSVKEGSTMHSVHREPERATQEARMSGTSSQGSAAAMANEGTRKSFFQKVGLARSRGISKQDEPAPRYIGVGGGGIVPGIDAPVSAVNAGERQVIVQYSDTSVQLPVTPSTRAEDLLFVASQKISSDLNPEKSILLESFHQLGLERPLRRYEHVRDVMNSWAHDADNRLVIVPSSSMDALAQLDAQRVPIEKPRETTVFLYHSQRPGKWDKRYVTLRTDGQIVVSKKEKSDTTTNICHLSDFDIYSPSARALATEIKPPKKICIAIKSQEKSSMFLSTENFIHFFSTNDSAVAVLWHRVTQAWRSWYLANKVGVAERPEADPALTSRSLLARQGSKSSNRPAGHESRQTNRREHAPPPTSFPKSLTIDTNVDQGPLLEGMSPAELEAATFSPTGLLGRNYTQRQQAMREREEREKRASQDPFSAHGLLGESPVYSPGCASTGRSNTLTQAPDALDRGMSVNQRQKPLVDLTPVFHEPPQHTRKGRGVTVEPGMQLIDAATGPDLALGGVAIPPATAWRRPSVDVGAGVRHRSSTVRSTRPSSQRVSRASSAEASPVLPPDPFQPNSLLASSHRGPSQSKAATGHGVATGDRNASRPLLDMSPESPFVEGSLLRKL